MPLRAHSPGRLATTLFRRHPEWAPWLRVLEGALAADDDAAWAAAVPAPGAVAGAPLLADAVVAVDAAATARLVRDVAGRAGLGDRRAVAARAVALLDAAINHDEERLAALAAEARVDPTRLGAIAPVVAIPLLLACNRAWATRTPADWPHGYCPTCGAWPVLAEARGLERSRRLRCGGCGGDWPIAWLRCPFCGTADHARLGALVPAEGGETRKVDTCLACGGYVKTVSTLAPCLPREVALRDLETVDLDLAAQELGYARPSEPGHRLGARVVARPRTGRLRRLFGRT
jgi:FdhE protein